MAGVTYVQFSPGRSREIVLAMTFVLFSRRSMLITLDWNSLLFVACLAGIISGDFHIKSNIFQNGGFSVWGWRVRWNVANNFARFIQIAIGADARSMPEKIEQLRYVKCLLSLNLCNCFSLTRTQSIVLHMKKVARTHSHGS